MYGITAEGLNGEPINCSVSKRMHKIFNKLSGGYNIDESVNNMSI